ncbi:MAG: hypothetical protein AAF192_10355 [Pseudomonadota bacterium]
MSKFSIEWETLKNVSAHCAEGCGRRLEAKIDISLSILSEVHVRASGAHQIFPLPNGLNYYKEAGVVCYWITKLKPFRIIVPEECNSILEDKLNRFPINECIALHVATKLIRDCHEHALNLLHSASEVKENTAVMIANHEKLKKMDKDIVNSLRYFIFSSGSMPLILEAILRVPLDDDAAFHL